MQQTTPGSGQQITISIVSHGHGSEVERLIEQTLEEPLVSRIILTLNQPETLNFPGDDRLFIVQNTEIKGFGANHNAAFKHCDTPYFCVLNPDIVLLRGSLGELLSGLQSAQAAVAGPLVLSPDGRQEDSWRRFPTFRSLFGKAFGHDSTILRPQDATSLVFPDWIAGMCMLFESASYRRIAGFDERLFLYYEDVDICARLWRAGLCVAANPRATIIHNAQRASRYKWEHMRWHGVSMFKYFWRYWFRLPKKAKQHAIAYGIDST
jgi:N-acetylglucosaminyl-diphospho-decaprenol L-rhamnosyltransferase